MCIVCNCGEVGNEFLSAHQTAAIEMKRTKELMMKCSKESVDAETRKRYDTTHKAIVRLLRDWNRLEELRESGHTT